MNMGVTAIVLAAGKGKRMKTDVSKQFLTLMDKPVIYYSLKAFEESSVDHIVLVTGEETLEYCKKEIVARYHLNKVKKVIVGGRERYDSVYQGLLHTKSDYVLIHDGARPFITGKMIDEIIKEVRVCKACVIGTPVKETIKIIDSQGFIIETPERNCIWAAQTPQAFEYFAIKNAYNNFYEVNNKNDYAITDDAMVYETFLKKPVKMLLGDYKNIKLTTPEDLIIAEQILMSLLCE